MWKIIPILQERKGQVNKYLYQENHYIAGSSPARRWNFSFMLDLGW